MLCYFTSTMCMYASIKIFVVDAVAVVFIIFCFCALHLSSLEQGAIITHLFPSRKVLLRVRFFIKPP